MADNLTGLAWLKNELKLSGEALSNAVDKVGEKLKDTFGNLGGLLNTVLTFFKIQTEVFFQGIVSYFAEDIKSFRTFISFKWADAIQAEQDKNLKEFTDRLNLKGDEQKAFLEIAESTRGLPGIMGMIVHVMVLAQFIGGLGSNAFGKLDQQLKERFAPIAASAQSIVRAGFVAPEKIDQIRETMRHNGLSDDDIDLLFLASYNLYDEMHIRALYFRGVLTESAANTRLAELGFTATRIEELKQGWKVIPGIQDLVMMQAKEAFEPTLISKYGLGAEEPTDIYQWTRKLGLDDEWTQKYWSSHWQHASYAQVMEMLHRGYIDADSVYDWYKLVEIPPFWRDLLTKIAYSPYTRVDVRRMHAQGVLDDTDLIQAMKDIGYDQEHAEKMAEFYKKYNLGAAKELTKSDIEKAYEDRDISWAIARQALINIGYDDAIADFYLTRIDLEMERAVRLERIDLTKEQFLTNLITEATARNNLVSYGLEIVRVNELIYRWKIQIVKNAKLPSKTDLDKMLRNEIIIEDEYVEQMDKLGYRMQYIDWYLKLIYKGIEA